jgi:hypothetical protein
LYGFTCAFIRGFGTVYQTVSELHLIRTSVPSSCKYSLVDGA